MGALGRKSFAHLCAQDLEMGATHATTLVEIVTRIPRDAAIRLREDRAGAVTEILKALQPNMAAASDALTHARAALAARAQRALHAAGLRGAIVEALAGRPAHARITLVDVLRLRDVGRALAKLPAGPHE